MPTAKGKVHAKLPGKTVFILGISGSPHEGGTTDRLANSVLDGANRAGARTQLVRLYDLNIGHEPGTYSEDPSLATIASSPDDDFVRVLAPLIRQADGLVFATPTYWANMSGAMKDMIDRLTALENDGFQLEGKIASCIAVSKENEGGVEMAAMSMLAPIAQMGMLIPPNAVLWHPGAWHTAKGSSASWAEEDAPKVGRNMVKLVHLLRHDPIFWSEE